MHIYVCSSLRDTALEQVSKSVSRRSETLCSQVRLREKCTVSADSRYTLALRSLNKPV